MGLELIDEGLIPEVPGLDAATNDYLRRLVALAVAANPDVEGVILFGSAARNELRPMTDAEPSDVDVLFLMTVPSDSAPPRRITREQHLAISRAEVEAYPATFDRTLRQVRAIIADASFAGWDRAFVESIARDGRLLWARGALPVALAPVARRPPSTIAHDRFGRDS
jgi:predicted nucleotidyltransferase